MTSTNGVPESKYITVTPDMAQKWLDNQSRNRAISQRRVRLYADMMQRGDWYQTNAGIAIDDHGQLIDGQHRLLAVIHSQTPVEMLVVENVPHKAQIVLDQPLIRRAHDQIAIREGWGVKPIHIAVAKQMIFSVGSDTTRGQETAYDLLQMDRYYRRHHQAVEFAVWQFFRHTPVRGITVAPVIAPVARAWYNHPHERLTRFADVLATGLADQRGDSPVAVFRNWLLRGQTQVRAKGERRLIYRKTEIALNAFLKGESIQRLGQMSIDKELFPVPNEFIKVIKDGKAVRKTRPTVLVEGVK